MDLNLRDYYNFYNILPIADDQVKFQYKNQISVFGDRFRRILFNANVVDNPSELIKNVKEEFTGFEIRWKIAPTDVPKIDWVKVLEDHGFKQDVSELGMIFDLNKVDLSELEKRLSTGIEIVELDTEERANENLIKFKMRTSDRNRKMVEARLDMVSQLEKKGLNYQHLIAKEGDKWIAHAVLNYMDDSEVTFLAGAITAKQYRRRGIYSTMLARRAAHAKQAGKRYLVINAIANTSAPILKKVGFHTIGEQKIMIYKEK